MGILCTLFRSTPLLRNYPCLLAPINSQKRIFLCLILLKFNLAQKVFFLVVKPDFTKSTLKISLCQEFTKLSVALSQFLFTIWLAVFRDVLLSHLQHGVDYQLRAIEITESL